MYNTNIKVIREDITKLKVDVIVNAANSSLLGGGGVDGAIHRVGGSEILKECKKIGGCETGSAVITTAGNLPSKNVIHTVGPVWRGGNDNEEQLLADCYKNSLKLANKEALFTVAFPNISTGVYRFPKEKAAEIAISTVKYMLSLYNEFREIYFVCFDDENYRIYNEILNK